MARTIEDDLRADDPGRRVDALQARVNARFDRIDARLIRIEAMQVEQGDMLARILGSVAGPGARTAGN